MRLFDEGRLQELFGELSCLARLDGVKLVTKLNVGPSVSNTVGAWLGSQVSAICL